MIKELHLMARTLYTFVAVWALSGITRLGLGGTAIVLGVVIFMSSFMFQYYVLHFALKNISTRRNRAWFLVGWTVTCLSGVVITTLMMPTIQDFDQYGSVEALAHAMSLWASAYAAFSAAFVALTCTRRAWTRHGGLG
jgi:hypothetical protein